jgi:hypothetical protein
MPLMSLLMWYLASMYAAAALTPAIAPATGAVVLGQLMWYDNDALVVVRSWARIVAWEEC